MILYWFLFYTFAAVIKQLKMKKLILSMLLLAAFIQVYADDVMRKEKDGTYVVNTTTLAADVKGYIESTPVEIYLKNN